MAFWPRMSMQIGNFHGNDGPQVGKPLTLERNLLSALGHVVRVLRIGAGWEEGRTAVRPYEP